MRVGGWAWAALAALLGAAFFVWSYGAAALDGTNVGWLLTGDRAQSYLGWHFYRRADASFPLGAIPSLAYPVGSSLTYSDATPWFAVLLGPLSPLLPDTFQIAGFWLLLAYALQGAFAYLVLLQLLGERAVAVAGSTLAVASPVLSQRGGHLSLCAHWLVLAAFAAALATRGERGAGRFYRCWLPLLVLASGTHPYLMAMVLVLALAACGNGTPLARLRLRGPAAAGTRRPWPATVLRRAVAVVTTTALALVAFGYVGAPSFAAGGFGDYATHLLAFVDADGGSRLLPNLPSLPSREGHAFLGAGTLLLLGVAIALRLRRVHVVAAPPAQIRVDLAELRLLAVAIVGLAVYALGPRVLAASFQVATLRGFYASLDPLPSIFRASGRFVWPLHLTVVLGSVVLVATAVRRRRAILVIVALAVALQTWDGADAYRRNDVTRAMRPHRPLSAAWRAAGAEYREIRLVPPYFLTAECPGDRRPVNYYVRFAEEAGRQGMRINSGHLSRQPLDALIAACHGAEDEIAVGHVDPDVVYVVDDAALHRFSATRLGLATCGRLDGFNVCTSNARKTRFASLVRPHLLPPGACADVLARARKVR